MTLNDIQKLCKLRKHYGFNRGVFIPSGYLSSPSVGIPSRIVSRASSLELLSPMFARESGSSSSKRGSSAGATSVVSAEGRSLRHMGHFFCVWMTASIHVTQKICLHVVILA